MRSKVEAQRDELPQVLRIGASWWYSKQVSGRSSFSANQTTSLFFVSGFGSGAYSAKLLNGTRQRFSGFSQPRQCGEEVLRMFVTGGPPVRGGGGMPHRINVISVPASVLRITGAG